VNTKIYGQYVARSRSRSRSQGSIRSAHKQIKRISRIEANSFMTDWCACSWDVRWSSQHAGPNASFHRRLTDVPAVHAVAPLSTSIAAAKQYDNKV